MNGAETQLRGNLGDVEATLPNHAPCCVDFHFGEVVDNAAAGLLVEIVFQLGPANEIILTDLAVRFCSKRCYR